MGFLSGLGFGNGFSLGIQNGPVLSGNAIANLPALGLTTGAVPQVYRNLTVFNNDLALYRLQIRQAAVGSPPASSSVGLSPAGTALSASDFSDFIFPLSPESLSYQRINLTSYYETHGDSKNFGVKRIIDQFGLTPPLITISGTTGFKFHNLDGFRWTGKQSILRLEAIIQNYAQLVQQAIETNATNFPQLFFYDTWKQQTWEVVPYNAQGFAMDNRRPLFTNYNIQLIAVQSIGTPAFANTPNQDFLSANLFEPQPLLGLQWQGFMSAVTNEFTAGLSSIFS